jgi:hypothetical protein
VLAISSVNDASKGRPLFDLFAAGSRSRLSLLLQAFKPSITWVQQHDLVQQEFTHYAS